MNLFQLPYSWSKPQLWCYLKIMFCSEVNFTNMSEEGINYLNDWASMCFQFQDMEVSDFFNELNAEMKKDQSTFFQNCFRESLQVGYTKDQKEFIIQGLLNSPEHLMQLYFTFLLHDYLFLNDVSKCTIDINMKFHQISIQVAHYDLIPHNLTLPDYTFLSIDRFQNYLLNVSNHWMNNGDFSLKIHQGDAN